MFRLIVVLAWLSLIPAALYWLRNLPPVRAYLGGFFMVWHSIVTASDQEDQYHDAISLSDTGGGLGALSAVVTLVIVALALLVLAGFTIYWAG